MSDQILNWRLTNEYPFIKTVVVNRDRWRIQKILFKYLIIDDLFENKYYSTLEDVKKRCELLKFPHFFVN